MTAVVMFLEMAVILFAGDKIRNVIGVNLMGVYLMMVLAYVLVRSVVQMKDHEMRKRVMVNVLGAVVMVVVLICAMRSF